jgi:8-oxo-dGTP pyrophosphatase MutT (NUDIX family)
VPRARARRETSAGGVVFRRQGDRVLFLLIRDSYGNWGFPKGHLEEGEPAADAALREVREETGLDDLILRGQIDSIEWFFRFRGALIHKRCHFFLMESATEATRPQRDEGIAACRWHPFEEALALVSYENAQGVLRRAAGMIDGRVPREIQGELPLSDARPRGT